jgi:soluble lytic murein transglycosylase-like protein
VSVDVEEVADRRTSPRLVSAGLRTLTPLALTPLVLAVLTGGASAAHVSPRAPARPAISSISQAADPTALAAAVARLRQTRTAAIQATQDTATELSQLSAAEMLAGQRLADARNVLQLARAADSAHIRELYVTGGGLSMFGELLTGGRPEDLLDRAQLATVVAAGNAVNSSAAQAAAQEAADLSSSIATLADRQITLATRAGRRAAQLTDALTELSGELATARASARRAALQAQQRAARTADARRAARTAQAAADMRAAQSSAELRAARAAATSLFDQAQQAGSLGSHYLPATTVPSAYRAALQRAGASCPPTLSPALLAAQLATESGWNPLAVSSAGAQGLAQFLPGTWAAHGIDGDRDGRADPFDPDDAIVSAAAYDCAVARMVAGVPGDPVASMLAGYNAGPGAVLAAGGVPASPVVAQYVTTIRILAAGFTQTDGQLR